MKRALLAGLLVLCLSGASLASPGSEPLEFLRLDANARAVAMGGAYTALATDSNALLYNPAGLAEMKRYEATFMHDQRYASITQEYASVAAPQGWGVAINHLSFGGVPRTTVSNPSGAGLGETGLSDLSLSAGYGREVQTGVALGGSLKLVRESIDGVSAQGFAADLGGLYEVGSVPGLTVAASILNIGPAITYQKADENLPLTLRSGVAYSRMVRAQECTLALDLVKERSEGLSPLVGLEVAFMNAFPLRLGYSGLNDAGPGITVGAGYRQPSWDFDYAFAPYGSLGSAHRLSVTMRWGARR